MADEETGPSWFAVRCIFRTGWPPEFAGQAYEERITIWRADSLDHAIERAEAEARTYATTISDAPDNYLGLAQAYQMAGQPGDGAEVFSLARVSKRRPSKYLDRFFDTGDEVGRQH